MAAPAGRLLPLIQRLLEATLDDAGWGHFLEALCRLTDATEADLFAFDPKAGRCVTCISFDASTGWTGRCDRLSADNCVWVEFADPRVPTARLPGTTVAPPPDACPAALETIAAGYPPPANLLLYELWREETRCTSLALRRRSGEPLPAAAAKTLEQVLPFLRRAFLIALRLEAGERRSALLAQAVEHGTTGVILLEASGRIAYANAAAREILEQHENLYAENGFLRAARKSLDETLQRLLHDAATGAAPPSVTLPVERRSGKAPYASVAVPVRLASSALGTGSVVCTLFVTDPSASHGMSEDQLRELFGLTPKEGKLAVLLAKGETLTRAAAALGIAEKTARIHLQSLFRKTRTRRQVDLVRLLLAGPRLPPAGPTGT